MDFYNLLNQNLDIPQIRNESYKCYPPLNVMWFADMENVSSQYCEYINIFAYIRKYEKGGDYIDIYVYDAMNVKRFIIVSGHKMEERLEREFSFYIRNSFSKIHLRGSFLELLRNKNNNIDVDELARSGEKNILLEMIYFSNFPSGLKEILYKANMPHIAYNLNSFEEVNLIGSTPKDIFDMPVKCLRYFENRGMYKQIRGGYERKMKTDTFNQFSSFIYQFDFLSEYQWKYLEDLTRQRTGEKGTFPPILSKKLFVTMAKCTKTDYVNYKRFYSFDKRLRDFMGCDNNPSIVNLFSELEKLEVVYELLQKSDFYNNFFKVMYEITNDMKTSDENYSIKIAKSIEEYIVLARRMNNCLITGCYIKSICERKSQILFFVPHTKNIDAQLAVEIGLPLYNNERRVLQAYGYNNRHLSLKEIISLYNFCKLKKIVFDVGELISEYSNDLYADLYEGELDEIYNWVKENGL